MKETPDVLGLCSVVIPVFQGARFIGEALESVRTQTHPHWEVLVVEDGSHDRAEEIVRAFANVVPGHRVHFERHAGNKGVSATRNTAIESAQGEYVALLDYDDMWRPGHLSASIAAIREERAVLSFCDASYLSVETGLLEDPPARAFGQDWRAELFFWNFIVASSVVLLRSALRGAGPFDPDPAIQFCEDYDYWLRLAGQGARFAKTDHRGVIYRMHSTQATGRAAMMFEREWLVLRKHMAGFPISPALKRRRAAELNLRNGMFFWSANPRLARKYLWRSAMYGPWSAKNWWLAAKRTATVRA